MIIQPVYHPFRLLTEGLERQVIDNPLVLENGRYEMNMAGLKKIVEENDCKVFVLCNPHNPGGRIWLPEELAEVAEICDDKGILVVSDEIHADLALPGYKHTPFAAVSEKAAQNSITFMAPSKTFNIFGIVSSFAVIPRIPIFANVMWAISKKGTESGVSFAYTATQAAYEGGEDWLDELLKIYSGKYRFCIGFHRKKYSADQRNET